MFGSEPAPQNEETAFKPRSPYAAAKLYAHWTTKNYREAHSLWAVSGILFNHESPRRGENFVTRKISLAVAKISLGIQERLILGNMTAVRDWGYAPEYVHGMWQMLQQDEPRDYVLATGTSRTVEQFCSVAFGHAGLEWQDHVDVSHAHERPTEVDALIGDSSRAASDLGWKAHTHADDLARLMVQEDVIQMRRLLNS
jgi:GDPmannose 4,6-dehydratase